jgi:hypothetical protein
LRFPYCPSSDTVQSMVNPLTPTITLQMYHWWIRVAARKNRYGILVCKRVSFGNLIILDHQKSQLILKNLSTTSHFSLRQNPVILGTNMNNCLKVKLNMNCGRYIHKYMLHACMRHAVIRIVGGCWRSEWCREETDSSRYDFEGRNLFYMLFHVDCLLLLSFLTPF